MNSTSRPQAGPGPTLPPYEVFTREACLASAASPWIYDVARLLLEKPVDDAISSIMEFIGKAGLADRAWMFEYDAELLRFRNTHEWCREGIRSFVEDLQDTPATMIGWLHRHLSTGKAVMVNDAGKLPRVARALQAEFLRQGDKSVLSIPLFHQGRLRACIGFDTVRAPRRWSEPEIKALYQCADLIGAARYGSEADQESRSPEGRSPLVYLRRQGGVRGTTLEAIVGLRSSGDYSEVWLADGSVLLDRRSLAEWLALTPRAQFMRVHRTAIVNQKYVEAIQRRSSGAWQLALRGWNTTWPVSRAGRAELRTRLGL